MRLSQFVTQLSNCKHRIYPARCLYSNYPLPSRHSLSHFGSLSVHVPLAWQVRIMLPLSMQPVSQVQVTVASTRVLSCPCELQTTIPLLRSGTELQFTTIEKMMSQQVYTCTDCVSGDEQNSKKTLCTVHFGMCRKKWWSALKQTHVYHIT